MGHKFADRTGQGRLARDAEEECSPVFLQFIDGAYQLLQQFPVHFEFSSAFLVTIMEHVFSCRFGTFLFNCEKDRQSGDVDRRTLSLWVYMNKHRDPAWYNPLFRPTAERVVLFPRTEVAALSFWTDYYGRWRGTRQQRRSHTFQNNLRRFLSSSRIFLHLNHNTNASGPDRRYHPPRFDQLEESEDELAEGREVEEFDFAVSNMRLLSA